MNKPRLFMVWGYTRWGGAQTYAISIAKRAVPDWDVTFVIPRGSAPELIERIATTGSKTEFLPYAFDAADAPRLGAKLIRQFGRIRSQAGMLRVLTRRRISGAVVHVEAAPWQDWLLLTVLAMRGAAVFVTIHNMFETGSRLRSAVWRTRFAILSRVKALHLFVTSGYGLKKLEAWLPPTLLGRTTVTYPGIDPATIDRALAQPFGRDEIPSLAGIEENAPIVLTVGQFVTRKGPWVLLESARQVLERVPNAAFVWITPQEPTAAEFARIASFRIGDRFRVIRSDLLGSGHSAILRAYTIADLFVLPSLLEGFPIALVEAMAAGLACISTPVQGIPEALSDGETGLLAPAGDSAALADAIVKLLLDRPLASNMGAKASAFARANFDEAVTADLVLARYRSSLADRT